jgi:hypothetical protein
MIYVSVEERYVFYKDYIDKVQAEVSKLMTGGFFLEEDANAIIGCSKKMVWPPVPPETFPFWKMRGKCGK